MIMRITSGCAIGVRIMNYTCIIHFHFSLFQKELRDIISCLEMKIRHAWNTREDNSVVVINNVTDDDNAMTKMR